jgi:hypothetical protein
MAGILKVGTITTPSGSGTITIPSGVAITGHNYPAFEAYLSSSQVFTNNTATKIQFDTETFDSDSCYDNSTNFRFTPNVTGKYFVYSNFYAYTDTVANNLTIGYIYKNGSAVSSLRQYFNSTVGQGMSINICGTYDMNGTTDYLEIYGQANGNNGDFIVVTKNNLFGAYRIGA